MRRMSLAEARKRVQVANLPAGKRIEHPDFDVRVFAQMHESPILAGGIEVIDQDAHPHAAIRREAHVVEQQPRGFVLVDDVVLNIERAFGMVGERDEIGQGLLARRQQADARQVLAGLLGRDHAAQRGGFAGVGQRLAGDLLDMPRQARATGQQHDTAGRSACA